MWLDMSTVSAWSRQAQGEENGEQNLERTGAIWWSNYVLRVLLLKHRNFYEMRTTPSLTRHHCQGLAGRSSLMPLKRTERVHHEKWQAYKFRVPTTRSLSTLWATLLASKVTECMGWSYCSAGAVGWSEQCKLVRAIRWSLVSTQKS